jgi:hypothetical protein
LPIIRRINWPIVYVIFVSVLIPVSIAVAFFGNKEKFYQPIGLILGAAIGVLIVAVWISFFVKKKSQSLSIRRHLIMVGLCLLAVLATPIAFVSLCASSGFMAGLVAESKLRSWEAIIGFAWMVGAPCGALGVFGVARGIIWLIRRQQMK